MKLYQSTSWGWNTITNNTYYDDSNRIVYKVHTPFKLSNRTTTITKTRESERERGHFLFSPNQPASTQKYDSGEEEESYPDLTRPKRNSDTTTLGSIDVDGKSVSGWAEDGDVDDSQTLVNESESVGGTTTTSSSPRARMFEDLARIDWRIFGSSRFRLGDGGEIEVKGLFRKEGWGPYGRHRVFTAKDGREYKWYLRYLHSELALNNEEKTPVAKFNRRSIVKGLFGKGFSAYLEIFPAGEHMVDEIFTTFVYIETLRKEKERAAKPKDG